MYSEVDSIQWNERFRSGDDYMSLRPTEYEMYREIAVMCGGTSLDIGCGTGQLTRELYHLGYDPVGLETSDCAIDIAQNRTTRGIKYVGSDLANMRLDDRGIQFALITCRFALPFVIKKNAIFASLVHDLLAKDGLFVVSLPGMATRASDGARMPVEDVLAVLGACFAVTILSDDKMDHYVCVPIHD